MIISITGPSGIGKGTLKEQLTRKFPSIRELPWLTTRTLRSGETNRIQLTAAEFEELHLAGELIFSQELFNHRYALRTTDLMSANSPDLCLTELHCQNVIKAQALGLGLVAVALITHDQSLLRHRLAHTRKSESMEEIELRLAAAVEEVETILSHRHLFAVVLEVTAETQDTIKDRVIELLNPTLSRIS